MHTSFAALRAASIEITQEPVQQPYGADFGIGDPFGNHIHISQPNTGSPEKMQRAHEGAGA
ncbi:hypothetical protein [Solicola sp. PLA-1-18]|uniref:hypothetical protein n=1 Tax=Solicola sp. PLA-1-18 TaxID=3380532 RepID=UPI003B7C311A